MSEIAEVFTGAAKKIGKALAKDVTDAYHGVLKDTEQGAKDVAENTVKNEATTAEDVAKADRKRKAVKDPKPAEGGTSTGGSSNGGAPAPKRRKQNPKYRLPRNADRSPVQTSTKVDPKTHDLAQKVNQRRLLDGDESGNNYAAIEYEDEAGAKHVVVGHSDGAHSERIAGVPLLKEIDGGRNIKVTRIYSERDYCNQPNPNCNAWTRHYFPDAARTHAFQYDHHNPGSKAAGNRAHEDHIRWLFGKPPIKRRS
ncbi:nucleic acid/nucleotide deaminase domain-containing protein [Streptacidiphilus sp. EB103A]|uniref:nucleic acid/nucleotide deaminase domain-containing protein n=1 Tax=Streptacidiphilus sp. EB103A TaxID=3156275 RepID=UPI003516BD99